MKKTLINLILATFIFIAGGGLGFTRDKVATDSVYAWGPRHGVTWEESEKANE